MHTYNGNFYLNCLFQENRDGRVGFNKIFFNRPEEKRMHFVGLGGAGKNIISFLINHGVTARFTYVNENEASNLKSSNVSYLQYVPPLMGTTIPDIFNGELPQGLIEHFSASERNILCAGLGGQSGTFLLANLLKQLPAKSTLAICTLPFTFEGPFCQEVSSNFCTLYASFPNLLLLDLNLLVQSNRDKTISEVLDLSHQIIRSTFLN